MDLMVLYSDILSRVSETIRLKLNIEAEEDSGGVLDAEFLSRLLSLPAPQLFAKISVEEGLACVVPIQYLIMFSSIILLADGDYSVGQSELKPIDSLAFGTLVFRHFDCK